MSLQNSENVRMAINEHNGILISLSLLCLFINNRSDCNTNLLFAFCLPSLFSSFSITVTEQTPTINSIFRDGKIHSKSSEISKMSPMLEAEIFLRWILFLGLVAVLLGFFYFSDALQQSSGKLDISETTKELLGLLIYAKHSHFNSTRNDTLKRAFRFVFSGC